jgi:hypothetical protein
VVLDLSPMLIRQFADGLELKNDLPIADEVNENRLVFMNGTIAGMWFVLMMDNFCAEWPLSFIYGGNSVCL